MKNKKEANNLGSKNTNIKEFSDWLFLSMFALFTLIFFSGQIFGTSFFWEDFVEYVYPVQSYAAKAVLDGSFPFWNPYTFSGMPFLADIQVGFFYPFNRILSLFVGTDGHLSVWWLQFVIIIHFFIAQMTFYFMMRYKGITQIGSSIGAIGYSFSMMLVCHVIHPMIVYHLAWFPLIFMFFAKSLEKQNYKYGIAAGLILGIVMLSGHPQTTLFLALLLGLYYLWYLFIGKKEIDSDSKFPIASLISGMITFIIALGVFQIQFLASSELAELSLRAEMTVEKSAEGSLEFSQILNFVNPHQFGSISGNQEIESKFLLELSDGTPAPYFYYWETAFYFGIITLVFGLIGILFTYRSGFTQFMIGIIVFGLLYSLGSNFFLHGLFYNLPFFGQFRNPARMMIYVVFGISILSGFGFDYIIKSFLNISFKKLFIPLGIVGLFVLIAIVSSKAGDVSQNSALLGLLYFAVATSIIILVTKQKLNYAIGGLILILTLFLDLYLSGSNFNSSKDNPQNQYQLEQNMVEKFRPVYPNDIFRVNTRSYSPPFMATKRNQGMVDKFMNTEGYNPLVLQRVNPSLNTNDDIYDLLNVKYVLKVNPQNNQPYFEENIDKLPQAWLVNKFRLFNESEIGDKMKSGIFDYRKEVLVEETPKLSYNSTTEIRAEVKCRDYKANYLRYEIINPDQNMFLVLSEIWYPEWKVFVDGLPAKLYRANYSLRAIEIPKGASKVELRFASERFALGQWITIVTLLLSIPFLVINIGKRKE